jgi:hypothetical protein
MSGNLPTGIKKYLQYKKAASAVRVMQSNPLDTPPI